MTGASLGKIGSFELLEKVGDGAEGRVYRARYIGPKRGGLDPGEIVALKRLKDAGNPEQTDRFRRAANILSQLNHPNIVRYKDYVVIQDEEIDAEIYCLVTEFLEGQSLKKLIQDSTKGLPWDFARGVMEGTLEALCHAARHKIIHRDLKPSNIYLINLKAGPNDPGSEPRTVPKLIDFGIARFEDAGATSTSTSAGFKGSFDYMAPEFGRLSDSAAAEHAGFHGDEQSDIYSFGVCLYEVITGRLPFESLSKGDGGAVPVRFVKRCISPPPSVPFNHPTFLVWPSLVRCVRKCLDFDREKRHRTFEELLADFRALRRRTVSHRGARYEFKEFLGRGGFGNVFRAEDERGRSVAVKEMISDDHHPERFKKEAKLLQKATHPHLVQYLDFIEVEEKAGSGFRRFYLILEYLKGMPDAGLNQRIRKSASGLRLFEVLHIFVRYLDCLHHLHNEGVIHRDIKPGNLYAPPGQPRNAKIFDLGIAHDVEGTRTRGQIPGTLDYMPPEFAVQGGERGTAQSDLYSLGVTLYQALTKKLPFPRLPTAENEAWVAFYQRATAANPPAPDFSDPVFRAEAGLEGIVRQALSLQPARRQRSAAEMREQLLGILQRRRKRRAYTAHLAVARAADKAQAWESAREAARRALDILPGETAASEIRDRASRMIYESDLAAARAAVEAQDWEQARKAALRALENLPGDAAASGIRDQAAAALQRRRELDALAAEARRLLERNLFREAAETVRRGLQRHPEDFTLQELLQEVERRRKETREPVQPPPGPVEVPGGTDQEPDGEYPPTVVTTGTTPAPGSVTVVTLPAPAPAPPAAGAAVPRRQRGVLVFVASVAILGVAGAVVYRVRQGSGAATEADSNLVVRLREAETAWSTQDWQVAEEKAKAALSISPDHPRALEILTGANSQIAAGKSYLSAIQAAQDAKSQKNWQLVRIKAEEALKLKSGDETAQGLLDEATKALQAVADYNRFVQSGQERLRERKPSEALKAAEDALRLPVDHSAALKLKADAEQAIYTSYIETAQAAEKAKDWDKVKSLAEEALKLRPRDVEASRLQNAADNAERDYRQLVAGGKKDLEDQQPDKAMEKAQRARALTKNNAEAESLLSNATYLSALQQVRQAIGTKDWVRAEGALGKAREIRPDGTEVLQLASQIEEGKIEALLVRARSALNAGDRNQATELAGQALKIRPDSPAARAFVQEVQQTPVATVQPQVRPQTTPPSDNVELERQLEKQLDDLLRRFGVIEDDSIPRPKGINERNELNVLEELRQKMRDAGILDTKKEKSIGQLKGKIRNWNGGGI